MARWIGRRVFKHSTALLCATVAMIGLMLACGGGGGSGGGGGGSVIVTPGSAQVQLGGTEQFRANTSVTWSLTGAGAVGAIDASGLYTAPSTGATPVTFTVTASSPTSGTGTASVTIISAVAVSVSPNTVSLYPNVAGASGWPAQTQAFTATVSNATNTAVNWTVSTGGGTIDLRGNYTAPAAVPSPAAVTVTATSQADPSRSGSGAVTIQTPTALGTFNVSVTATEGSIAHSEGVTLTVQ
jgi:hypothetical protein